MHLNDAGVPDYFVTITRWPHYCRSVAYLDIGATTVGTGGDWSPIFLAVVFKKQEISQQVVTRMQDSTSEFSKNFRGWYSPTLTPGGGDPSRTQHPAGLCAPGASAPVLGPKPWSPQLFSRGCGHISTARRVSSLEADLSTRHLAELLTESRIESCTFLRWSTHRRRASLRVTSSRRAGRKHRTGPTPTTVPQWLACARTNSFFSASWIVNKLSGVGARMQQNNISDLLSENKMATAHLTTPSL